MKKIFVVAGILLLSITFFGQEKYDSRLLVRYNKQTLERMAKETPGHLNWLNFHISHMYEIIDKNNVKTNKLDTLKPFDIKTKKIIPDKEIGEIDPKTFNPYLYNIKEEAKEDKYYIIPGTNKVVHIFPRSQIINEYNKTLNK
jgi:hypothetical protein